VRLAVLRSDGLPARETWEMLQIVHLTHPAILRPLLDIVAMDQKEAEVKQGHVEMSGNSALINMPAAPDGVPNPPQKVTPFTSG
jgi:hypothetical protein